MHENKLMTGLSAVPGSCWTVSSYADRAGVVTWLPLVQVSVTGIWLGLDRQGMWTLGRLDGVVQSSAESLPSSWVTILDMEESLLRARLTSAAARFGLPAEVIQSLLPIDDVLKMAIRSRSNHWVERAVLWMSERGVSADQLRLLEELATAEWANQRIRHGARRLLKASG